MSSIEKRVRDGQTSWRAHYRTPDGKQRNKTFARKGDAERFLATLESAIAERLVSRPGAGSAHGRRRSARWLADQAHLKPSTLERYAGILRERIEPQWGRVRLADVSPADVQSCIARLAADRSPATVRKVHRVLSLVLALAVNDGRLARNAGAGVSLPRVVRAERQYLTHSEVERLAEACAVAPAR